jgi:hypothetical protein
MSLLDKIDGVLAAVVFAQMLAHGAATLGRGLINHRRHHVHGNE